MDIIILILLIMASTVFLIITGIIVITWERNNKVGQLRANLSYFPPDKLSERLEMYKNEVKLNLEIAELETKMDELSKRDYLIIQRDLDQMKELATPLRILSFGKFRSLYKSVFKAIASYESSYLEVRFQLFDLTSDIEIEKAILNKLKEQTSHVTDLINNSPIKRISESKKLDGKISRLRRSLKDLEIMIDEQVKHLSPEFFEHEKKISSTIKGIADEVDFMNQHIKHLGEDLNVPLTNIVNIYETHKAVLEELKPQVVGYTSTIKNLKEIINSDIDNLKITSATKNMELLDKAVNELYLLINSNVDYAKFNYQYDTVPSKLLKFVKENHGMFTSEIRRHRLQNEQARLLYVESAYSEFEETINKFELEKMNQINKHAPDGIHRLLMGTIDAYKQYIKVVLDNVSDISEVNASTNDVNNKIARMNTLLLQVEYNIKSLEWLYREQFEKEKESIQDKVKVLRENFKDNTRIVDQKAYEIVDKIMKEVEALVEKSKGAAFELFFLKETIMYINRYKGNNTKLDIMIDSVTESFNDEKYSEALRKAKEIIEIYGIK